MNILFICTANRDRSKTAEHHFRKIKPEHEYKSCGINEYYCKTWGGTYLKREHLEWADKVFCLYDNHVEEIQNRFENDYFDKITNLHVEDIYSYGNLTLIRILEDRLKGKI